LVFGNLGFGDLGFSHMGFGDMEWNRWLSGRKGIWLVKKLEWWDAGVVICLW